jgi:hypothetical protein
MRLTRVAVLADKAGKMKVGMGKLQTKLFPGFSARARVWRLAVIHVELAAAGAPKAAVWFLCALEQKNFVLFVEAVEERRNFVGKGQGMYDLRFPRRQTMPRTK